MLLSWHKLRWLSFVVIDRASIFNLVSIYCCFFFAKLNTWLDWLGYLTKQEPFLCFNSASWRYIVCIIGIYVIIEGRSELIWTPYKESAPLWTLNWWDSFSWYLVKWLTSSQVSQAWPYARMHPQHWVLLSSTAWMEFNCQSLCWWWRGVSVHSYRTTCSTIFSRANALCIEVLFSSGLLHGHNFLRWIKTVLKVLHTQLILSHLYPLLCYHFREVVIFST